MNPLPRGSDLGDFDVGKEVADAAAGICLGYGRPTRRSLERFGRGEIERGF